MKKISNWSLIGMFAGAIFAIISFIQYYMLHRDIDRIIAYPVIGLLLIAISWLYHKQLSQGNTIEAMSIYLADGGKKK